MDEEDRKRIAALEKLHGVPRSEEWVTEHPPQPETPPDAFAAKPVAEAGSPLPQEVNGDASGKPKRSGRRSGRGKR